MKTHLETTIPFDGFYNSIHDSQLDTALNDIFSDDHGIVNDALRERAFDSISWLDVHLDYAKKYTKLFKDKFEFKTLEFKLMCSPKYYNFETDRIVCSISLSEVKRMFKSVGKDKLEERIKERFTSCSGFISHYPNHIDNWPIDLKDWDLNHVGTLLSVFIESHDNYVKDLSYSFYEDMYEFSSNLIYENITNKKVFRLRDYLRIREERAHI